MKSKKILILLASKNDLKYTVSGMSAIEESGAHHYLSIGSVHREPEQTIRTVRELLTAHPKIKVIIAGAHTATGLPGVVAGMVKDSGVVVLGVRFTPTVNINQDGQFNLSEMPSGVPMAYTGHNLEGFLSACKMAIKIVSE